MEITNKINKKPEVSEQNKEFPQGQIRTKKNSAFISATNSLDGLNKFNSENKPPSWKNAIASAIRFISSGFGKNNKTLPAESPISNTRIKQIAFSITSAFEGGRPNSLQTVDDGIISYGIHQATLRSGSLEAVIKEYNSLTGSKLFSKYMPSIEAKSPELAANLGFLSTLKAVGDEPDMGIAQQAVFSRSYWEPSSKVIKELNLESALAASLVYDTHIQGGANLVLRNTLNELGPKFTETDFISSFIKNRKTFLYTTASKKRAAGKESQARMLENSAKFRVAVFEEQLSKGNLNLEGVINVLGNKIEASLN